MAAWLIEAIIAWLEICEPLRGSCITTQIYGTLTIGFHSLPPRVVGRLALAVIPKEEHLGRADKRVLAQGSRLPLLPYEDLIHLLWVYGSRWYARLTVLQLSENLPIA